MVFYHFLHSYQISGGEPCMYSNTLQFIKWLTTQCKIAPTKSSAFIQCIEAFCIVSVETTGWIVLQWDQNDMFDCSSITILQKMSPKCLSLAQKAIVINTEKWKIVWTKHWMQSCLYYKKYTGSVHLSRRLYIKMDDVPPLHTTVQKWSQNITDMGAAILWFWHHLEPESVQ